MFKGKFFSSSKSSKEVEALGSEATPHGLHRLHPVVDVPTDRFEFDIVAIHGLNGDAFLTWTDEATGKLWLRDFLSESVPSARMWSFGYDSAVAFSESKGKLRDFALDLLDRLRASRRSTKMEGKPIVFICHSLGGIVAKKALILAHEQDSYYKDIKDACHGIIFFGTPHRGSEMASWATTVGYIANAMSPVRPIRSSLLKLIVANSSELDKISQQFVHRAKDIQIVTFVEKRTLSPLGRLVVEEKSAVIGIPNERVVPINLDHRAMCRFGDPRSQVYQPVLAAVLELVGETSKSGRPPPYSSEISATPPEASSSDLGGSSNRPDNHKEDDDYVHVDSATDLGSTTQKLPIEQFFDKHPIAPTTKPGLSQDLVDTIKQGLKDRAGKQAEQGSTEGGNSDAAFSEDDEPSEVVLYLRYDDGKGGGEQRVRLAPPAATTIIELEEHVQRAFGAQTCIRLKYEFPGHYKTMDSDPIDYFWDDIFTTPVQITNGHSVYDEAKGLRINKRQTLASFFSKLYPNGLEFALDRWSEFYEGTHSQHPEFLTVGPRSKWGQHDPQLLVTFNRTVRVPENKSEFDLPPGLGFFPLFNTQDYKDKLPQNIVSRGGLFFPMYQREAMWMGFTLEKDRKFILKIYVGGVNALTGEALSGNMTNLVNQVNTLSEEQDYVVLPHQRWLDGICSSPGIVRQFVATPIILENAPQNDDSEDSSSNLANTSGVHTTVESQRTGRDAVGGIQIQVIPEHKTDRMFFSLKENSYGGSADSLDPLKTPLELKLKDGDVLHIKNLDNKKWPRSQTILDVWELCKDIAERNSGLHLRVVPTTGTRITLYIKTLTGKTITARCASTFSVTDLKCLIEHLEGIPPDQQRIIFNGKQLVEGLLLSQYNINHEDVLHLVLRLRGGAKSVNVLMPNGKLLTPTETSQCKGAYIKQKISEQTGIPVSDMVLIYEGKVVPDDVEMYFQSVIELKLLSEPDSMGIAPGGKIKQIIVPDEYDPRIWDTANSKLIHFNILNSAGFERVTGHTAPATPIDIKTYLQCGLPFYESYCEKPSSTVGNQEDNFRSLSEVEAERKGYSGYNYDWFNPPNCCFCHAAKANIILRYCNHCICQDCAEQLKQSSKKPNCPQCNSPVARMVTVAAESRADDGYRIMGQEIPLVSVDPGKHHAFKSINQV